MHIDAEARGGHLAGGACLAGRASIALGHTVAAPQLLISARVSMHVSKERNRSARQAVNVNQICLY